MESPFRSEEAAFRFLLITIGAFALIVVASWISAALGFLTFIALSAAAARSTYAVRASRCRWQCRCGERAQRLTSDRLRFH